MRFENIYKETEENMRLALLSLWTPGLHPMRSAINELFDREPLLAEPVFQSTFGWEPISDNSWQKALNAEVINKLGVGVKYPPYKHQAESWKALHDNKSIVVTSGTGSGKTECFMFPVLSDLYEQGHNNAIEAIFLYPLNALMEDQKKRLSSYCQATGLHFAVYNGDTPEARADGRYDNLPNEVVTREEIRDSKNQGTRPEILLTNPSMLEYILVRQKDQQMLQQSAGKLRWIVIDEAHSYSGSAAVELAYQIKRILEAFGTSADKVRFACTSATIGGKQGTQSLAEFISNIIGQPIGQIQVIGGNRLIPALDSKKLSKELKANHLPSIDKVLSLRKKINEIPGMTLQQMWEWLCPNTPFNNDTLKALQLLDRLCEMKQGNASVLSLRAHFFMRAISGLYACANDKCSGVNTALPLYGHLTTYKSTVCPTCGVPLLELVQCKRCGGFVLMGCSDSQTHMITPCEEGLNMDDYFSLDPSLEQDDEDERDSFGYPDTFFLLPYEKDIFFNPVGKAHFETISFDHSINGSKLKIHPNNDGNWVEVRNDDGHSYCPSCGRLAQGKRLNLKHFRIPINFINQTISPALLHECAPTGHSWGKYIAFTDSRQGTAISAKTFNINVERIQSRERILQELVSVAKAGNSSIDLSKIPQEYHHIILSQIQGQLQNGLSLEKVSDCIYDSTIFEHITGEDKHADKKAYKAALTRQIIGRKTLYENNAENIGLISLVYPAIKNIKVPNSVLDYEQSFGRKVSEEEWHNYLKISLDYFFRAGNHIQPLIDGERKYVRDANIGTPVAASDDLIKGIAHWPTIAVDGDVVSLKQHRLVLILCAGLGIMKLSDLQSRKKNVSAILLDAWKDLVDNRLITLIKADDTEGYNDPHFYKNNKFVGCYFLDLSGEQKNTVCRVELAKEVKRCPITGNLLDTVFCGYSPLISGEFNERLFQRYKCSDEIIKMPVRPDDNDLVDQWIETDQEIEYLKKTGIWSDRHKYSYKKQPTYIAAEHSAQQSKKLLREYTKAFSQDNPTINVLHCSTTMEMGVDIGDIDVVLMDTIPPTAANYLQRVGRAGRMGQTKSVAYSLCNNTPVGQYAFANPMWALQTSNHMINVRPSQTIIQRHINSYFFRQFVCCNGTGIQATMSVDDFMSSTCASFIQFLDSMSTNSVARNNFENVFGSNTPYTINITKSNITDIQNEYNGVMNDLNNAFNSFSNDSRRQMAISNQMRKLKSENLLSYLSEHQFIPNANMPTGVVTFDFIDKEQSAKLHRLYEKIDKTKTQIAAETDATLLFDLQIELNKARKSVDELKRATSASRDIHTALNEYAPEQTVVVNERNYVSAGISFLGAYNDQTQTRAIYHCTHCGHTEYRSDLDENRICPVCHNPYHGIIDKNGGAYTLAYEPVGFCTDQNVDSSREEKTEKHYYDIRPVLLKTDWRNHNDINMCEMISSGESGNILFYNVGSGRGFAFCKRCGRAAVENSLIPTPDNVPKSLKSGHNKLWGGDCDANDNDIARNVVLTGIHPTCYTVMKFKKDAGSSEYENDEQLVYSLGVILKRALAISEGVDEGEIDFGIKQEIDAWVLFIFDTVKGGCGYSLKLMNPVLCQQVFDIARTLLENTKCTCHIDGGACTQCLVDRNNYRYANLLSKAKALDWLNRQKGKALNVPSYVKSVSPSAKVVYLSLKDIVKQAIKDSDVRKITMCVSDVAGDTVIADWSSVLSEMGKYINYAVANGKSVALVIEYHPELHFSMPDKLPFINLKDKFPDCDVKLVKDMGKMKSAVIVESSGKLLHYFTDNDSVLSFSNNWGKNCSHVFVDSIPVLFTEEAEPTYEVSPSMIVREGFAKAYSFQVCNYFSSVIARSVLKPQDIDMLTDVLRGKRVSITFSDMYVNSALASLMLVYLIDEMKQLFGFTIEDILLQLDSPKRRCNNERFNEYTPIGMNFPCQDDADDYTENLISEVLEVSPDFSSNDADHHRWLKIETEDGGSVEIRPDHGISGGYRSDSNYMNLDTLNGSVVVYKNNEDVLYYVIIKKGNA